MAQDLIRKLLTDLGYEHLPSPRVYAKVETWDAWYRGKTNFHAYQVYNGQKMQQCIRKSLRMAKHMAEDKADLLLNEKVSIIVGQQQQERFDDVLEANNFYELGNQLIERSQALGTGAFLVYLESNEAFEDNIRIDYISDPRRIWPLSWSQRQVRECAFASSAHDATHGEVVYLSLHLLENGVYVVHNYAYTAKGEPIPLPEGLASSWTKDSPIPTFTIYRPNIVNNIDEDSPLGLSIYANSIDILKVLDAVYDSYFNEFILGRKRIFADASVLNIDLTPDGTGETRPVFDPNDTVFYNYPGLSDEKGKPIVESDMKLRVEEHQRAIQDNLDLLSEQGGFGKGYYRFTLENVQTATGVVSQNSKLFRKIRKDELLLRRVLKDLAKAILLLLGEDSTQDISVSFDDSIIEDTTTKTNRALLEYEQGVIDLVMYLMETRGLTKPAATMLAEEILARLKEQRAALGETIEPSGDGHNDILEGAN